jgi:hypothetical protein
MPSSGAAKIKGGRQLSCMHKIIITLSFLSIPLFANIQYAKGSIEIGGGATYEYVADSLMSNRIICLFPSVKYYLNKNCFIGSLLAFRNDQVKDKSSAKSINQYNYNYDRYDYSLGLLIAYSFPLKYCSFYFGGGLGYLINAYKYQPFINTGSSIPAFIGVNIYLNDIMMINIEPRYTTNFYSKYQVEYSTINLGIMGKIK